MPLQLSEAKRRGILQLLLEGMSFGEVADSMNVSKSTVSGVWKTFSEGRTPGLEPLGEYAETIRQVAVQLHETGMSPGDALLGLQAIQTFAKLTVEPRQLQEYMRLSERLAGNEAAAPEVIRAALEIQRLEDNTGLDYQELQERVQELVERRGVLEAEVTDLDARKQEVQGLRRQGEELREELGGLQQQQDSLRKDVGQRQRREQQLTKRVQGLEERAQAADERLAAARRELQALAGLGLSFDDLSGFVQRLSGVAQRHHLEPINLREHLFHELEELDEELSLGALVDNKRRELTQAEQAVKKAQEERAALEAAIRRGHQQQDRLRTVMTEDRKTARKEIKTIAKIARDSNTKLRQDLGKSVEQALIEVQKLKNQAVEAGQELGQMEAVIKANQWLVSLHTLVEGYDGVTVGQVRVVGLKVLRALSAWLDRDSGETASRSPLSIKVTATIEELERWRA